MKKLLELSTNRVWRTYTGGKLLDEFLEKENPTDGHTPEEWISSVTEAKNPNGKLNEGLSIIKGNNKTLKDEINNNPNYYLGESHTKRFGNSLGILLKLLDSSERLTIQVHPDKIKAKELFNSQFGKTEAWVIKECREINGEKPHIFFGFKEGITRDKWEKVFKNQNINEMLNLMHKIYVKPGDVFLIEGGIPHAIGAGCFILEIQEPTDLTIRTEKVTPNGYEIPDQLLHQGIGFDKMFECFNYSGYSEKELQRWFLTPKDTGVYGIKSLIDYSNTECFSLESIKVEKELELPNSESYSILIVLEGLGEIISNEQIINIKQGTQIFIPYGLKGITIRNNIGKELLVYRAYPPKY